MKNDVRTSELSTILGKGSEFEGKIKVEHTMRVDGKFGGDIITSDTLIVGKEGNINGNVKARNLVVGGKVSGSAEVKEKIVLESKAEFHGDMKTSKLVIDEGAVFDGRCSMKSTGEQAAGGIKSAVVEK